MNNRWRMGLVGLGIVGVTAAVALAESKSDAKAHEEGLIKEANTTMQEACGCPSIKFDVDWDSYSRGEDMVHISNPARNIADRKVHVCSDDKKAAWCKWSKNVVYKIHMSKTKKYTFTASKDGKTFDCGMPPWEDGMACEGDVVIDAFKNAN